MVRRTAPVLAPFRLLAPICLLGLVAGLSAQPELHPDELKLKPAIDRTIGKGVEHLMATQGRDGTWGVHGRYVGGRTGLGCYALLKCGVRPDHPSVRRALAYLDAVTPAQTYANACVILAYGATGLPEHRDRLQELADIMLDWQKSSGDWGYPENRADLSCTQYAALGLYVANKGGADVSRGVWVKLARRTLRYQEKLELMPALEGADERKTGSGQMLVGGFSYVIGAKPTGSMTTAGVSILQICKLALGERIAGKLEREIDQGIAGGKNWLAQNFSVKTNPGKGGGWHYYYLYGLERVGSLLRVEQLGPHWWFLEGARFLLGKHDKKNGWGNQTEDTCFALLFLRRATMATGPTTGKEHKSGHLFSAGGAKSPFVLKGAGQQPLMLWIHDFGEALKEQHKKFGLRVTKVEYLQGDRSLGELAGDAKKSWTNDTFLHRATLHRGKHQIRARVTLVAPEVGPGTEPRTVQVDSDPMDVVIRDVFEPWMKEAAQMRGKNQLMTVEREASASSGGKTAARAVDGQDRTHWVSDPKDAEPWIQIDLKGQIRGNALLLSQPPINEAAIGRFDRITEVEVRINREKEGERVQLNPDPVAITRHEFDRTRRIGRIVIVITGRERRNGRAGFAEIAIVPKD